MPNEVHVVEGPQGFALICAGDPNGAIRAPQGTLAVDNLTPALWQNSNGVTTWVNISGGGGGGGFPVGPLDDGTNTYEISAAGGQLDESNVLDADNDNLTQRIATVGATAASIEDDVALTGGLAASIATNLDTGTPDVAPFQFSWNGTAANLAIFAGDPNGTITAPEGSLAVDTTTPALWQNTDGATTWAQFAGASSLGTTGLFATGAAASTIPTGGTPTAMTWPTLTSGSDLFDHTTPTAPTVLTDGVYTIDAFVDAPSAAPASFDVVLGTSPVIGQNGGTIGATPQSSLPISITSFLTAGTPVTVFGSQNTGGSITAQLATLTATKIG